MIHIISLLISIGLAVYIRRKGLTTVELRELLIKQSKKLNVAVVKVRLYRVLSGGVWLNLNNGGWVQARWCEGSKEGYLTRLDREGSLHKTYVGILKIEDYTKG